MGWKIEFNEEENSSVGNLIFLHIKRSLGGERWVMRREEDAGTVIAIMRCKLESIIDVVPTEEAKFRKQGP
jgi:hypothetical protein